MYKSACRIAPCAWLTGFQKGIPLCSMGVFSGGVPLRQENALLSYGFSVQNSHWSRNRLYAQGCASLSRWNGLLNRLYLVYRLFGFNSAQIVVQVFVLTVQVRCIPHTVVLILLLVAANCISFVPFPSKSNGEESPVLLSMLLLVPSDIITVIWAES